MSRTYQDDFECPVCGKETPHTVYDDDHERDMSNCWRECSVCHAHWSGLTGRYALPEGFVGKKALFLDFDGVLNDGAFVERALSGHGQIVTWNEALARTTLDPVRVARVQAICDSTGCDVVLVTGWRRWAPSEVLASILRSHGLTAPVLGVVGGLKMSGDLRVSATAEWLEDHPAYTSYVVLDDDLTWKDPWNKRYVDQGRCIHPLNGIEDTHVQQAIGILGKKEGTSP